MAAASRVFPRERFTRGGAIDRRTEGEGVEEEIGGLWSFDLRERAKSGGVRVGSG